MQSFVFLTNSEGPWLLFAAYSRILCPDYVEVLNRYQSHLICWLTEVITTNNIKTYIKHKYKKISEIFKGRGCQKNDDPMLEL